MKHVLSILFILVFAVATVAQSGSKGCFKAYAAQQQEVTTFCVGQEITFQDCGDRVPDENEYYIFDYKAGSPIPTPSAPEKKHTYTAPGKYRVLQIANYGGATLTDTVSQVYEVKAAVAPTFKYTSCADRSINITITDQQYDRYTLDFGDGQQLQAAAGGAYTHTYARAGNYTIVLTGSFKGAICTAQTSQIVAALPVAPQPGITSLKILQQAASGELEIQLVQLKPGYAYVVETATGTGGRFTQLDTIRQVAQTSLTYKLPANTATKALYRVRPIDTCGNSGQVSNNIGSVVSAAVSDGEALEVYWESLSEADHYEVYRNGSLLQTVSGRTTSFRDENVSCGQVYTYSIKQVGRNGSISVSADMSITAVSAQIPPAPLLLATFDLDNQLQLTLQVPPGEQVQITDFERSTDGPAAYEPLSSSPQPSFTDTSIDLSESTCYRASYTNSCGNTSAYSNITCPMLLQATRTPDGAVNLTWSAFTGFSDGVGQYTVELLSPDKQLLASYTANGTSYIDRVPGAEPQQLYRIRATSKDGTAVSFSNIQTLEQPLQLFVPSAFTPNNDGLNDIFEVKGRFFNTFRMQIYNSMGNLMYASSDAAAGWDGTYKGKPVPAGAYTYTITVTSQEGVTTQQTGTITLLR